MVLALCSWLLQAVSTEEPERCRYQDSSKWQHGVAQVSASAGCLEKHTARTQAVLGGL